MPKFRYTAKNLQGEMIEGLLDATDRADASSIIRMKEFFPVSIAQLEEKASSRNVELQVKIPIKALALFCTQLAAVLRAGVPIVQALEIMKSQTENKMLKKVLQDVQEKIRQGKSLSSAFRDHARRFPEIFLSMIESGEAMGTLESALAEVGLSLTKEYKITNRIKSAMMYPIALTVVAFGVLIFLLTTIVPKFAALYASSNATLPKLTSVMLSISNFLTRNVAVVLLIVLALVTLIVMVSKMPSVRHANARLSLRLPVIGKQLVKVFSARFTRSLSGLSAAGVPIASALSIAGRNIGNMYIATRMETVVNDVNKGRGIAGPLQEMGIFPLMVIHMVRMGEESGTLDQMLAQTADFYEEEADAAMARLLAILEPAIIVVMGVMVLTIVLSVVLPMFGMYSAVNF